MILLLMIVDGEERESQETGARFLWQWVRPLVRFGAKANTANLVVVAGLAGCT